MLHRTIVRVQRMFFDPPVLEFGRMPRVQQVGAVSAPILVLTLPEKALCCQ